jgi:argininosuccinate lyase
MSKGKRRMWGGRFQKLTDQRVKAFNASVSVDQALAQEDIEGSIAHVRMLAEQAILDQSEVDTIVDGLIGIRADIEAGRFVWDEDLEDVHMNIEFALTERIGPLGGKLHTARSRNDQVATDFRLWLRKSIKKTIGAICTVETALVDLAEHHISVIMPGYTHLQVAQPILFSHHLMAYVAMLDRDRDRLSDSLPRVNVSPLGAGALAGTGFNIDRDRTAELLGFDSPAVNSLDAVSDRDFALEYLANASILIMHLSRFHEELVLWSSPAFGFVTLPDSHTTGSSIMPQKKNPDVSELIRGKTGRIYGSLMGLLTVMKGLPLSYNKDMQEDKEGVIDTSSTILDALELTASMIPLLEPHPTVMAEAAASSHSNATDLADYLVSKGMPFREAHHNVGRLVAIAIANSVGLADLGLAKMRAVSELFDESALEVLSLEHVINARNSFGGTARAQVESQIGQTRVRLAKLRAEDTA